MSAQLILHFFPDLSDEQIRQFEALEGLYKGWNAQINVISRKDIDQLYLRHVLHSLAIAKVIRFRPDTRVMDLGTGGGFPGIPLAILFPEVSFHLIDSIGKKIKVASAVAEGIGLKNTTLAHRNAIEEKGKFDFVVSRAVMPMPDLVRLVRKNIAKEQRNALPNGVIALKGGDLTAELSSFKHSSDTWEIASFFSDDFFETKQVAFVAVH